MHAVECAERKVGFDPSPRLPSSQATAMTDHKTPHERRSRLLQAQTRLKEEREQVTTARLLLVIIALACALVVVLMRRYGVF